MAVALVQAFGDGYEQIILVGDPLFMKRLTDHAAEQGLDWRRYRVNAVIGEETFGEHFRGYSRSASGWTPIGRSGATSCRRSAWPSSDCTCASRRPRPIALRRAARAISRVCARPARARHRRGSCLPMILTFNPQRTFIEIVDPDARRLRHVDDLHARLRPSGAVAPLPDRRCGAAARSRAGRRHASPARRAIADSRQRSSRCRAGQRDAAERVASGFYKDALYANPQLAPPPHRRRSPDLLRPTVARCTCSWSGDRRRMRRWSRACCRRFRPTFARRAWCSGRTPVSVWHGSGLRAQVLALRAGDEMPRLGLIGSDLPRQPDPRRAAVLLRWPPEGADLTRDPGIRCRRGS